ncbi:RsmB/NOP family class I SAM-dependent RNA methyltransferase [Paracnuella aquatica]|uniref:RsmB/NOP family class I SAM-dependent RNA methyltransferase n=1 Tax=Paracnuella aquatica TaxID=2268757 RepID=UPI001F4E97AC|nr:RsmB/NOP family class I SAM-dependent RNA methyltransferase [Paracnuella aquatica]
MAIVPPALLQSLQHLPGFDAQAFIDVHAQEEKITSIRVNPLKFTNDDLTSIGGGIANTSEAVPWSRWGHYLPERPSFTFDPLFHAGCYYVQEASSMFLEQAITQLAILDQPLKVLDLCAAPGGKSTHLQSLISKESLLVSNEVIRQRAGILRQNMTKWGGANVVVTANDPQHFARLEGFFDVLVVDAPCSGSGLFRRDPEAINEWSPDAVQLCCGRQRRILSDALPCLAAGGLLVYSTCSYSAEEDEAIADWLVEEWGLENLSLEVAQSWGIVTSQSPNTGSVGYRFFPDQVKGEGFYLACFRKGSGGASRYKTTKPEAASSAEKAAVAPWIAAGDFSILKEGFLYALPAPLLEAFSIIKANLYVQQAGVRLGEVMKGKLVPDHALALSEIITPHLTATDLDLSEAIKYLQRLDLSVQPEQRGWQLARFGGHNLGWMNALGNRINNYYPKEFRILKQA